MLFLECSLGVPAVPAAALRNWMLGNGHGRGKWKTATLQIPGIENRKSKIANRDCKFLLSAAEKGNRPVGKGKQRTENREQPEGNTEHDRHFNT